MYRAFPLHVERIRLNLNFRTFAGYVGTEGQGSSSYGIVAFNFNAAARSHSEFPVLIVWLVQIVVCPIRPNKRGARRETNLDQKPNAAAGLDRVDIHGAFITQTLEDAIKESVKELRAAKVLNGRSGLWHWTFTPALQGKVGILSEWSLM